jgi:hypothetical protein
MVPKRGQAANIATLISLIALFMILYILLLPQEARDDLLQNENGQKDYLSEEGIEVLFSKEIGDVSPLVQSRGVVHTIAGANLFSNLENEIVTLAKEIVVSKGIIGENSQEFDFELPSPQDVKKVELYMIVEESIGSLIVDLNGRTIFNSQADTQELIELPLGLLQEINTLTFRSSSPGGNFWRTNINRLRDLRLRKQLEIENKVSKRTLSIPASEIKDLEKALMSFSVFCNQDETEILEVYINNKLIYSDVPFCNLKRVEMEVDNSFINSGANNLEFRSEGDYVLEEIEWRSLLKGERASEYAFNVDENYNDVRRGSRDVLLIFDFPLSDEQKIFDVYINENKFEVNTFESSYLLTISDYLERGSNLIRLRPRNSFEIIDMRVELD